MKQLSICSDTDEAVPTFHTSVYASSPEHALIRCDEAVCDLA